MIEYKEIEEIPNKETFGEINQLCVKIFGAVDLKKLENRFSEANDLLINLAFDGEKIVGFKIGYKLDSTKFYSWLGGVDENYRKSGIAQELMKRQHDWCVKKGCKIIQTKTKNSFKPMLILNIKNGFDVVDVYRNSQNLLKIVLEKNLAEK